MGNNRKKHNPVRMLRPELEASKEMAYQNPGVDRELHTDRLTSGLPYQRPVDQKEVDRLIREWESVCWSRSLSAFVTGSTGFPPCGR